MNNRRVKSKVLIAFLVFAVCLPLSTATAKPKSGSTFQTAEVHTFPGAPLETTSGGTLLRKKGEVWARLAMHGLEPDSAYTAWWVVFNKPENCAGGFGNCGPGDFGPAEASILNATGFVTSGTGSANATAHLRDKSPPSGLQVEFGDGLKKGHGHKAELHMLFLWHGPVADLLGFVSEHIAFTAGGVPQYGIAFPPVD